MILTAEHKKEISEQGFTVVRNVFSDEEIKRILKAIDRADTTREAFRKSKELFAIRRFLIEVPETVQLIFSANLKNLITDVFGGGYFVVKAIYFDKPESSNWFVSWHQDLTISVDRKTNLPGFGPWTVKQEQFAVQPPIEILESIYTIRIHLDNTNEDNGALKVVPKSHLNGICRTGNWNTETETNCSVTKGGAMIMKPLLLHSSGRTTNGNRRRVIHLEFCKCELPEGINWAERIN